MHINIGSFLCYTFQNVKRNGIIAVFLAVIGNTAFAQSACQVRNFSPDEENAIAAIVRDINGISSINHEIAAKSRATLVRLVLTRWELLGTAAPDISDGTLVTNLLDLAANTSGETASALERSCSQVNELITAEAIPVPALNMVSHEVGSAGTIAGLNGAKNSKLYFKVNVPHGITDLVIQTNGTEGDADLYVSQGARPTKNAAQCYSMGFGLNEQCRFDTPDGGAYYILLNGYADYSDLTLKVSWRGRGTPVEPTMPPKLVDGLVLTEQLPPVADFSLKNADTGLGQLTFAAGAALPQGWSKGAVVYIEPGADFPQGQFFKVDNVTLSSVGNRVDVVVPALDEVFEDLEILFNRLEGSDYTVHVFSNPQMRSAPMVRMRTADGSIGEVATRMSSARGWFPNLGTAKIDATGKPGKAFDGVKFTLDGLTIYEDEFAAGGAKEKVELSGSYEIKDLDLSQSISIKKNRLAANLSMKYTSIEDRELTLALSKEVEGDKDESLVSMGFACGGAKKNALGGEISGAEWKGDVCLGGIRLTPTPPSVTAIVGNRAVPVPFSVDVFFFIGTDLKVKAQAKLKVMEESVVERQIAVDTAAAPGNALRVQSQVYDGIHFRNTGEKIPPKPHVEVSGKIQGSLQTRLGVATALQAAGIYPVVARGYGYARADVEGQAEVFPGFDGVDGGLCYKIGIATGAGFTAGVGVSAKYTLDTPFWDKRILGWAVAYNYKKEVDLFEDKHSNCVPLGWSLAFDAKATGDQILVDKLTVKYQKLQEHPTQVEYELRKRNGTQYVYHDRIVRIGGSPVTFFGVPQGEYAVKVTATARGMQTVTYRAVSVTDQPGSEVSLDLQTTPGDGYVDLSWNAIPGATSYMVHMTAGVVGPEGPPSIGTTAATSYRVNGLQNGTLHRFTVRAFRNAEVMVGSGLASATPQGPAVPPVGELIAGRYLPIDGGAVIRDTVNGLEWQRCSVGQTWNGATQRCDGVAATYNWDQAIQLTAAGGFRIPTIAELKTLVYCSSGQPKLFGPLDDYVACGGNYSRPTVVQAAFPDMSSWHVWSGSPDTENSSFAWGVYFGNGFANHPDRSNDNYVRLVRGEPSASLIAGRYLPIDGGAVIRDTVNGLEWQRCSVGQTWNGARQRCDGSPAFYNWDDAIRLTAVGGFRIPTIDELKTLVYCSSGYPKQFGPLDGQSGCLGSSGSTFVATAFPTYQPLHFWSGSILTGYPNRLNDAWHVHFYDGIAYADERIHELNVRLVRNESFSVASSVRKVNASAVPPSTGVPPLLANLTGYDGSPPNAAVQSERRDATGQGAYFLSRATNLVPGINNGAHHLFHFDASTGQIKNLGASTSGAPGDGDITAFDVALQAGKLVFRTKATNLESGPGLYLVDLHTGQREPLVTSGRGEKHDPEAERPAINAQGTWVAWDQPGAEGAWRVLGLEVADRSGQPPTLLNETAQVACCVRFDAEGRYLAWREAATDGRVVVSVLDYATGRHATVEWPAGVVPDPDTLRVEFAQGGRTLQWVRIGDVLQGEGAEAGNLLHQVNNPLFTPPERLQ